MNKLLMYVFMGWASFASCSKVLDTNPEATISDEAVIVDKKSAQAALVGVYDAFQGYSSSQIVSLDLAGDNVVNFNSQNNLVANKTPAGGGGGFSSIYVAINRVNFLISRVLQLPEAALSTEESNQLLGEAYFLRALFYFDLVKVYGGVQIVTEPSTSPTSIPGVKRSTKEATYAQVLADLERAEPLLKEVSNRVRANRFTVYALKARFYLYNDRWDLAEQFASKTIASTVNFRLVKPYSNFFTGRLTEESILEQVYTTSDRSSFYTNWNSPAQGGRHDYIPAREFAGLILDPTLGGSRSSLLFRTPQGVYDLAQYSKQDGTSSIFILRIAEQFLIRAEARAKKAVPDLAGAISDINQIRIRADLAPLTYDPSVSAATVLLAIEKERRFELGFEGHRYIDIIRTGRAAAVFGVINPNLNNPGFWLFPIPQSAIQNDTDLEQNPGYK